MPYSAEISRSNPACFLFLVDQSRSMQSPFGREPETKKADGVADAIEAWWDEEVAGATVTSADTGAAGPASPALSVVA